MYSIVKVTLYGHLPMHAMPSGGLVWKSGHGTCCSTRQILDHCETGTPDRDPTTRKRIGAWAVVPWVAPNIYHCLVKPCPSDIWQIGPTERKISFGVTEGNVAPPTWFLDGAGMVPIMDLLR
jgi:hypothetical protein